MSKVRLTLLVGLSISLLTAAQSINYNQEVADLIATKKWFEVERYYQQHKDSINHEFVKLLYLAETGSVFNNSAQSIDAYEQMLENNPLQWDSITLVSFVGQSLVNACASNQAFSEGNRLCKKMIDLLRNDTSETAASLIRDFETIVDQFYEWKIKYPIPEVIDTNPHSLGEVALLPGAFGNGICFNAAWNGVTLHTIFDTGASSCYIANRAVAEKLGIKLNTADTVMLNGGTIRGLVGIVDSLTFGKFVVKNVPVCVSIESIDSTDSTQTACDSLMNTLFDIILGMPVIKQLGVVVYDVAQNTLSFPKSYPTSNQRNLFIGNNASVFGSGTLYLDMKIADDNFLTFFDTGGFGGLSINTDFYEKHKQQLPVESEAKLATSAFGGCNDKSVYARYLFLCPEVDVQIKNQKLTLLNDCAVSKDTENEDTFGAVEGGFLGNDLFKYCRKAIFDFNHMEFSVE